MIAEGTYRGRARTPIFGKSSKGNEQIAVTFDILDIEGTAGDTITWYGSFTDKAIEYTIKNMQTLGWVGPDISEVSAIEGTEVDLVIAHEVYDGKTNAKVKFINEPGVSPVVVKDQLTPEQTKAFATKMKGKILALTQQSAKTAKAKTKKAKEVGDDIPF